MRLRNKKTGEVKKMWKDNICLSFSDCNKVYYSIAELNDEWEDYEPAEPLIKDEKIRKAIRAWAEANEIETVDYDNYWVAFGRDDKTISFKDYDKCLGFYGLDDNGTYTIDELCGEEEE